MLFKQIKLPAAVRHSAWSVLDAAIYPVVYLATVPLMIKSFGIYLFGVWIVLNSLVTILQLFNLNLGITTMQNIASAFGENNEKRITSIINSVIFITGSLILFVVLLGLILSTVAVGYGWWGLSNSIKNISLCILLASVFAGLKFFDQVFQSIIKAKEEFKLAAILNIINRFGLLIITVLLAIFKYDIYQILTSNIVFLIFYLLIQFLYIKKILPFYKLKLETEATSYKKLIHFSIWPWLQAIIVVITFQTDRFWISAFAGLNEVSGYGLVSTIFNHIHIIFTAMAIWLLPRLSAMASKNEELSNTYEKAKNALLSVMLVSLLFFYFISPFILNLWLGAEVFSEVSIYVKPFIAFEMIFAYSILPIIYFNATGKEKLATWVTLFYSGLTYICMISCLYIFREATALIEGMTLAMCVAMPILHYISIKSINNIKTIANILMEMLPVYAAITLLYVQNIFLIVILLFVFAFMLWKYYLSGLIDKLEWKQQAKI